MGWTNFEFPHSSNYDSDLRELLRMYKKLVEDYSAIKNEIEEVTNFINDFYTIVDDSIAEAVESNLKALNIRMDALVESISRLDNSYTEHSEKIGKLQGEMIVFKTRLETELIVLKNELIALGNLFADYKNSLDSIIKSKVDELILYIEEHVAKLDRLYVTNPITGDFENVQNVLDMICDYLSNGYGLSAKEYDSLGLTALQYDSYRLTALLYSTKGYLIFFKQLNSVMRNPFTGQIDTYDNIIQHLSSLHKDSLTADEYDELTLTAEGYDLNGIDSYNYDWNGKVIALEAINV